MSKKCIKCQAEIPASAKFCPQCGADIKVNPKKQKARHKTETVVKPANYQLLYVVGIIAVIITALYGYRYFSPNQSPEQHNHAQQPAAVNPSAAPAMDQNMYNNLLSAFNANPAGAPENINLGNFLFDNGRYTEALEYYHTALKIEPNNTDVIVDAGVCYFNQKNFEQAKMYFNRALKINGKHPNALYNLGVVAAQMGQMEEMMTVWNKLIDVAPESGPAATARQMIERIKNQM